MESMGESFHLTTNIDYKKLGKAMAEDEILIGWPQGMPHEESGEDISEIAMKLSFGAGPQTWSKTLGGVTKTFHVEGVPARPILEDGIEAGKEEVKGRIAKYWEKKVAGENAGSMLAAIGAACVGAVQRFARMGVYKSTKPNSSAWSDFKKGAPPWIDTGQVINSLTFVVHDQVHEMKTGDDGKKEWVVK